VCHLQQDAAVALRSNTVSNSFFTSTINAVNGLVNVHLQQAARSRMIQACWPLASPKNTLYTRLPSLQQPFSFGTVTRSLCPFKQGSGTPET
jgi:hypothetical protein